MRLTLPLLLLAGLLAAACFPKPDEPIDYLELPEAIVVQKKTIDTATPLGPAIERACATPELTLYGDGTLVLRPRDGASFASSALETTLREREVRDLLESALNGGFVNFNYDQPRPSTDLASTTYIYVHTQETANAVAIDNAGEDVPEGREFDQYRHVAELAQRLDEVVASRAQEAAGLTPSKMILSAVLYNGEPPEEVIPWTGPSTPSQIASGQTVFVENLDDPGLPETTPNGFVSEGDDVYYVCSRPYLPYEENFPEFEPPASG